MTQYTEDELRLARNIVLKNMAYASAGVKGLVLSGAWDRTPATQAALAAIRETTERAAELAFARSEIDDGEYEHGYEAAECIAADLRNGEHLKP